MASITRFGERTPSGAASFRCAECGELAGLVRVARAGSAVDLGPPLGRGPASGDGLVVDYFLGTAWMAAAAGALDAVQAAIDAGGTDPLTLRSLHPELAPFYCPDCALNYCAADWHTEVVLDDGFYDSTVGTCPNGHRHLVDD